MQDKRVKIRKIGKSRILTLGAWKFRFKGNVEIISAPPFPPEISHTNMDAQEVYDIRRFLSSDPEKAFSQEKIAKVAGLNSGRAVRAYELGEQAVKAPIAMLFRFIRDYGAPKN